MNRRERFVQLGQLPRIQTSTQRRRRRRLTAGLHSAANRTFTTAAIDNFWGKKMTFKLTGCGMRTHLRTFRRRYNKGDGCCQLFRCAEKHIPGHNTLEFTPSAPT